MPGECNQCGKCCLHMRRYIIIERSVGENTHYCRCKLTKEQFLVRIAGDDLKKFSDKSYLGKYPDSCPFLREYEEGAFHCVVYGSRPSHCRQFICDSAGKK